MSKARLRPRSHPAKKPPSEEAVSGHQGNIPNLLSKLGSAKLDWREADVAFITAHKAKGLEFDFVARLLSGAAFNPSVSRFA